MSITYCNPLDLSYRYQHFRENGRLVSFREGADPTLVLFKGTYYLFVSMSAGFWYSQDLLHWDFHTAPDLPIYEYAPDVRQIGNFLYFCATREDVPSPILRSADPLSEKFEPVSIPFPFADPNLFWDEDGRVYLYGGCTNTDPIWGVELDPGTMQPQGERQSLIAGHEDRLGYERPGENATFHKEESPVYQNMHVLFDEATQKIVPPPDVPMEGFDVESLTKLYLSVGKPYIEGAFMTKHSGRYYLQYACPGTEYNTYADGVYVADQPLGPFTLQTSNPFSSKPGGFITGAGHGSTIQDKFGNYWHAATMRISINHRFERRVGLFPAGFDEDGTLYCNQNFADYPPRIPQGRFDPWSLGPEWMLLSYGKAVTASSSAPGSDPASAVDEDIRTWWSAASADPGQWLTVDLGHPMKVHAIQVNLADENLTIPCAEDQYGDVLHTRCIELTPQKTCYTLEASGDGARWTVLQHVERDAPHGYFDLGHYISAQYIRLTCGNLPFDQPLRVSGLRVFGLGDGTRPAPVQASAHRLNGLEALVCWQTLPAAQGYNVRYGTTPDKLYHSWLVYGGCELKLTTLVDGQPCYVRVDSFNENGITEGTVIAALD